MAQELITATLKQGLADGITLYEGQIVSIDLSNYIDLKLITGETIAYPYSGTPITGNAGYLLGKTVSKILSLGRTTVLQNTDGSLAGFGYIKKPYSNIDNTYNTPIQISTDPTLEIGQIIKLKGTNTPTWLSDPSVYALTEDNKLLDLFGDSIIATNVIDFAVAFEADNVTGPQGAIVSNLFVLIKTADGLKARTNGSPAYFSDLTQQQMAAMAGKNITQIEGCSFGVFALCSDNTIYAINGVNNPAWAWESVPLNGALTGKTVTRLVGGHDRIFALCTDGTVAGLGNNAFGKLGNGNSTSQETWAAVSMTGVLSGKTITDVSVGIDHTLFLCSDGTVVAVGGNSNGQLGNGSISSSITPVKVYSGGYLSGKTPIAISAGGYHSAVITNDGGVYTWGSDASGQLGNGGGNTNSAIPVPVSMFHFTKYLNHVQFSCADLPQGLFFNGNLLETAKIIGAPTKTGVTNALIKIDLSDFTLYDPIPASGNIYEILGTGYLTLPISVLESPPQPPPPPPLQPNIIRNGNMLMDAGVNQNIKVSTVTVYQTVYVRVTGLPAGMKYTGSPDGFLSGYISGAPLASGTYNVTIAVSYKTSETSETLNAAKTVVYTVNPVSNPAILLADQNLTSGVSVNLPLLASDASMIVSWSATGLPDGLVCGTGIEAAITGTPSIAGTYNSTVTLVCRKINSSQNTTITKPVTFTIS